MKTIAKQILEETETCKAAVLMAAVKCEDWANGWNTTTYRFSDESKLTVNNQTGFVTVLN